MALAFVNRLQASVGIGGIAVAGIIIAALAFIGVNLMQDAAPTIVNTASGSRFQCTVLSVYDGDGPINCAEVDAQGKHVSVRLRGIEARDADNSCSRAELCPQATGAEAKAALTKLAVGRLECVSFGPSYERVDASCVAPTGLDLSCEMIRSGMAMRWPEYDQGGRLVKCDPAKR